MPGRDGTGPRGMGATSGRAAGACAGAGGPGRARHGWGAGAGMGRGGSRGGHGWRRMFHATGLPGWQRAASLEQALDELRTRIDQLEKPVPNAGPLPEKDAR